LLSFHSAAQREADFHPRQNQSLSDSFGLKSFGEKKTRINKLPKTSLRPHTFPDSTAIAGVRNDMGLFPGAGLLATAWLPHTAMALAALAGNVWGGEASGGLAAGGTSAGGMAGAMGPSKLANALLSRNPALVRICEPRGELIVVTTET